MKASENTHELPPFPAFPCVARYVPVGATADALDRVRRSIKSADGVSLVIGPPGTGKSLACRILADEFRETHDVVLLGEAAIDDQTDFHRHLLYRLGVDLDSVVDGDLHLALIERVCGKQAAKGGLLIIVDEAQCLPVDVLEAIRMVTNIMRGDQPRVTAVVCGGVKLDDTLTSPALEPFTQRVSTRCYLHPLNAGETRQYICESIRACDSNPEETISDEAIGAIHHACCGVPRLINQLMTEAIDCAADNEQDHICEKMIDLAWAQLQQLPSPMTEEPKIAHNVAPVEFGALSDMDSPKLGELATVDQVDQADDAGTQEEPPMPAAADFEDELSSESCESEVATIRWAEPTGVDESLSASPENAREVPVVKPLPATLFGEFEVEEPIPVGNGVRTTTPLENAPAPDLESMIHSQIVSLSELAADSRFGSTEAETQEIVSLENDRQPVIWIDEPESDAAVDESPRDQRPAVEPDDIVLATGTGADDSDLLVIEEDIDLTPRPEVMRVDARDEKIVVDFHAMLKSMRQNS